MTSTPRFALAAILSVLALPLLVFAISAVSAGMTPAETLDALVTQCRARRQNPALSGLLGLLPVALLFLALRIGGSFRLPPGAARGIAWGGLLPILAVLAWANFSFWPKFLPSRVYPGFPHGLELVLGPVVFAPIAMLLGMLGAWFVARSAR